MSERDCGHRLKGGVSKSVNDGSAPWIKIVTRIFEDAKIVALGELPDGDSLMVCWFRLLCLAGEQNRSGSIYLTESVAFTPEILAAKWRCKPSIVQLALTVFCKFGMISIDQEGTIWVLNWSRYQNEEGLAKIRERSLKQLDDRADAQNANERLVRKRELTAKRQRDFKRRCKTATGNTVKGNTPVTHQVTRGNAPDNAPVTHRVTHLTNGNSNNYDEVTPGNAPKTKIKTKKELPSAVSLLGRQLPADTDLVTEYWEAKCLICERILNGKDPNRLWSADADKNLLRHLPIPRLEIERVAWFRGMRNDGSPELEARKPITETGLMAFWGDEVTRANAFWQKLHGWRENEPEPKLEEAEEPEWTNERVAATRELFPGVHEHLFERPYAHVAHDIRAQIERRVKKMGDKMVN